MTMAARWIVERVNVVRYLGLCKFASSVNLLLDAFLFEAAEKRLCDRVVPAVSATAHTRFKMICLAESPPIVATILLPGECSLLQAWVRSLFQCRVAPARI